MGEKFAANPVTGTGSMTVPIATSPGRSGFGPQLSLTYDSGAGNGPFGFGWSLSLPAITRKTDKGLPKYQDALDSDVFILSGAEDLVPLLVKKNGTWEREKLEPRTVGGKSYEIQRYRPRIEGLFARIERWINKTDSQDTFWRSISKDNVTTWYGKTAESRIVDPANPPRIFSWLICQSHDDKGNVLVYGYKPEDSKKVPASQAHERNRTDHSRSAQRYLKRIRYGNRKPYLPELKESEPWPEPPGAIAEDGSEHWLFEVVFDYDEPHYQEEAPDDQQRVFATASPTEPPTSVWPVRPDPFSTYRAGFEIRTYRLCQRVLMFHHFPSEDNVGKDCLVRSTDFTYEFEDDHVNARVPIYSFLTSVTQSGYVRQGDRYLKKSLPPVDFTYSKPEVQGQIEEVDPDSVENLPIGLDGMTYQWTDLHGEGIPGILSEQGGAWFYKRNWSPIPDKMPDGSEVVKAKFSALETVALKPSIALSSGAQFMDLAGDGQPDFVTLDGPTPGFYEHDEAEGWEPFQPFTARLNRDTRDPNLKFVDLDGDGHADVLITEDETFVWHESLAESGFGPARLVAQSRDEEKGPRLVFADGTQSIYLADLSGDGLTDLMRIRNGEVCYWPNLGFGRFGTKVTMDRSPQFDRQDLFDQKRIRLADIDGSGTTDIIYLHRDGVRLYFNQSGNSWSQPRILNLFPHVDDLTAMVPTDLLGNGTACLVWSSPLSNDARRPMRYVNLMGKDKPHLLVKTANNLGAETRVQYAPSTKFYLQDKLDSTPWITKLPFPVHVIERVETYDHISRSRFTTRYAYHHGYFDGEEREFRGFGMVEQWDTEEFSALSTSDTFPMGHNIDAASHVPPMLTKTWFHTGLYLGRDRVSQFFAGLLNETDIGEYYREPGLSDEQARHLLLADTVLPSGLSLDEEREACRALKGSMLRQEVYALDGSNREKHPYTVTEQNFTIRALQPRGDNKHGVFFTYVREALRYHYERNPADPRVNHTFTLMVNDYGDVLQSATVGYGRRPGLSPLTGEDKKKQEQIHITAVENTTTNVIDEVDIHRTPLPSQTWTYEIIKVTPDQNQSAITNLFQFDELVTKLAQAADGAHDLPYEDVEAGGASAPHPYRRLIEQQRTLYRRDDLNGLLPVDTLEPLALSGENYKLAFTPGLLATSFQRNDQALLPNPADVLGGIGADRGGYVGFLGSNGHWWIPSGRSFYHSNEVTAAVELAEARQHFFLPRRYRDPFGQSALVDFDTHDVLMTETRDALNNRVTVEDSDYRVLQPRLVSDPNRNRTKVAFDALGMVVGTAVMGKEGQNVGDFLDAFVTDLPQTEIQAYFDALNPRPLAISHLGNATTRIIYNLDRVPVCAASIAREIHSRERGGASTKVQLSFVYSDGFGREIQKKIQAEPGPGGFAEEVMADKPIAYYRLGERLGTTNVQDASGNNNHSVAVEGGVTLGVPGLGLGDTAALFDGATGRIIVPNTEMLNPPRITMEAIIRWDGPTASDQQILVKQSYVGLFQYGLSVLMDGHVKVWLRMKTNVLQTIDATSTSVLAVGTKAHVVATYDVATSEGRSIRIYLNGLLDSQKTFPLPDNPSEADIDTKWPHSPPDDLEVSLAIGDRWDFENGTHQSFKGLIDEAVIYPRALPAERIRAHAATAQVGGSSHPRWVGSGWTIFNNKGKPVRQYEPFFSAIPDFEFGVMAGVSSVLFYDPGDRVIATLHPNHTYEKARFDPWQQTTYDVNDTCAARNAQSGDPRTDHDIGGYVAEYFATQPADWQTWYTQRIGGDLGPQERDAAVKAAAHADSPTTAHFDTLGRPFLTMARNRVVCSGHDLDGTEESFATRIELDIEGNQRAVRDAVKHTEARDAAGNPVIVDDPLGRIVMRYAYDMLGNRIHQLSMEAGARWMLNDVAGKPIRAWDSRGHNFTTNYDALRRPIEQTVRGTFSDPDPLKPNSDPRTLNRDILVDKIEYGEPPANASQAELDRAIRLNLRTRIYRHFDSAGVATNARLDATGNPTEAYDFKGNLLRSTRRLVSNYTTIPDWLLNPKVDDEFLEGSTRYDALNRPIQSIAPYSSLGRGKFNIIQPVFNEANLLERVDVWLERAAEPGALLDPANEAVSPVGVANIDYDAKGQRQRIDYKNGTSTFYTYDPLTFRLTQLLTKRKAADFPDDDPQPPLAGWPGKQVQNFIYTYDPAGNIIHIQDDAQQTVYFRNKRVEPSNDYVYDALYRLIQANGREHLGQNANGDRNPSTAPDAFNTFHTRLDHPGNGQAMGTYIERYVYDAVGNFLQMQHRSTDPAHSGWTRRYTYNETSLIEDGRGAVPLKTSNRLTLTTLNPVGNTPQPEVYQHDAHGNMLRMPHLGGGQPGPNMHWDYKDQLRQTDLGGGGTAFYVYDASGQRVRKVWEKAPGLAEEHIYLGGFEIFRKHNGPSTGSGQAISLERETLHVMDDKQRISLVETRTLDSAGNDQAPRQLIRYQFGNHLGSASLELNDKAKVISYEEYFPYGSTSYQAVDRDIKAAAKRYRYTGKERDEESGFYYHGARYYAPWLGRWTVCDPADLVDGPNLYCYARSSPVVFVDLRGTQVDPPKEFLPGLITDYPRLGQAWRDSAEVVLENKFGKGSYAKNLETFHAAVEALPEGAKRTEFARELFNSARSGFYRRVGKLYDQGIKAFGGIELPKEAIEKLRSGSGPGGNVQIDHAIDELALNPKEALNEMNLGMRQGHAGVPGGSHHTATEGRKTLRASQDVAKETKTVASGIKVTDLPSGKTLGKGAAVVGGALVFLKPFAAAAGPIGDVVEIGMGVKAVADAPPEERGRVAAQETGSFAGGALGTAAGAAGGVLLAGLLVSNPAGWLVLGLGLVGGGIGGYLGGEGGRAAGGAIY